MKDFPKDLYQLYQVIEEFHKRNPDTPIMFVSTDREKVIHLVTNHPTEIYSSVCAIKSDIKELLKDVINEDTL